MNYQPLLDYMNKRQAILLARREGLPKPWTDDVILRTYSFCNVYREDDTVTKWINDNIRVPFANHPMLWLMLMIGRTINWPGTLSEMIEADGAWPTADGNWNAERAAEVMQARADRAEKVYTGAYMIRAESDANCDWYSWTKHRYITNIVCGRPWADRKRWVGMLDYSGQQSQEAVHKRLTTYHGWGPFMAYEVVTDMRHTRYLSNAPDILTWANAGPGAIRGLNRLLGRDLLTHPKATQTNDEMFQLMKAIGLHWEHGPLEMRDIEHSLCEFDKYERVRLGQGRPRAKYAGA